MTDMADSDGTKMTDYSHGTNITRECCLCNNYSRMSFIQEANSDGISFLFLEIDNYDGSLEVFILGAKIQYFMSR